MNYYDMPENTEEEKAKKEIAECNYCINGVCKTMRQMKVPQNQWRNNMMIKAYLDRIRKAESILRMDIA